MRVVNFEIGDRVIVIINNEMCKGNIERLHVDLPKPVAILNLDDGEKAKVYLADIIPEPKEVKEETEKVLEEPKRESVEKSEITITPDEFKDTSIGLITDLVLNDKITGNQAKLFTFFSANLARRFFIETKEND